MLAKYCIPSDAKVIYTKLVSSGSIDRSLVSGLLVLVTRVVKLGFSLSMCALSRLSGISGLALEFK